MTSQITVPIWIFLLLLAITGWAVLARVMIPSVRWFLRRRIDRVLDEIGSRLDIEIRPFQLTKRQVLIDRLVYDPKVIESMQAHAQETGTPREVVQAEIQGYAKEIVPSFNAYLYFRIAYWLAKKVARSLYWVRIGLFSDDQYVSVNPDSTVVFVMNHRSNMDYILLAFLAAERTTLSYAVGEWAKIWPLQMLIRAMGAFFVRRKSGNALYRRVLERYIHMATHEGVCQPVFLEGGLSRDGTLNKPKLGLVDYMLRQYDRESDRDIVFIPVGINYDRTIEDRSLVRSLDPEAKKRSWWFVLRTTFGFIGRSFFLMGLSRWRRYGYAGVNFGSPVSVKTYCETEGIDFSHLERGERFQEVDRLCRQLMEAIAGVVPILPLSILATIFLGAENKWLGFDEIEDRTNNLIQRLQVRGAPVLETPRSTRIHAIGDALDHLLLRRLIEYSGDRYRLVPQNDVITKYYANSISYWLEK